MRQARGLLILILALTMVIATAVPAAASTPDPWEVQQRTLISVVGVTPADSKAVRFINEGVDEGAAGWLRWAAAETLAEWHRYGLVGEPIHVTIHVVDTTPSWAPWAGGWVPFNSHDVYLLRTELGSLRVLRHELLHAVWSDFRAPRAVNEGLAQVFEDPIDAYWQIWGEAQRANPHLAVYEPEDGAEWSWTASSTTAPTIRYHEAYVSMRSLLLHLGRDEFLRRVQHLIDGRIGWRDLYANL